jgi:outer membrane protein OmpA-like peptidoglycan-associated protein
MRKTAISVLALLALSACETAPPPSRYDYGPPPSAPPQNMRPYSPPVQQRPMQPVVRNVKPMGVIVTAKNVEAYTDTEENELRAALHGTGVLVSRMADDLVLNMHSDALFAQGSADLSPRADEIMQSIAYVVRKYDATQLQVNGYTDTAGSPAQNQTISQQRATSVARALTGDGVDGKRVLARGFGEKGLKIPTGSGINEPRNRRVEIRIRPVVKT